MLSAIRKRAHLSPATVIAGLALAFTMTGGAYAAKKYLITSTKQINPTVLKQLQGKAGPAGANGAQGPAGSAGPQGPAGANGKDGSNGANGANGKDGANGTNGKSVVTGTENTGTGNCEGRGGATVEVEGAPASKKVACNGKEGSPWTAGGTLPSEATETGTWWMVGGGKEFNFTSINFPIPLSTTAAEAVQVKFWREAAGKEDPNCPGNTLNPKAEPGFLCIYFSKSHKFGTNGLNPQVDTPEFAEEEEEKVGPSGAEIIYNVGGFNEGELIGGSFAITAP